MLYIHDLQEGVAIFKCLSSPLRVSIINLLLSEGPLSMTDISQKLEITGGALTPHIKQLVDNDFVTVSLESGKHGLTRICSVNEISIMINPTRINRQANVYESEIGVGQYTEYEAYPTCGLATTEKIIGKEDEPRFFTSPERMNAGIVWIGHGYFEYLLPNFLKPGQKVVELQISMELSSEAPGSSEDWPSDIYFHLNGVELCHWTSPADFGRMRGIYNPSWWERSWNQYGLFKLLSVDHSGTYIDGLKRSDVTLDDLNITHDMPLRYRIGVPKNAEHVGGMTIFGRSFGNYDQAIKFRMHYKKTQE